MTETSANSDTINDLVYATVDGRDLKLDIYRDASISEPQPLVVWIHGGAWRKGNRKSPRAKSLVSQGYVVASVEYRLSQEAIFPAQIHDCKAAIRWLRSNAGTYGIDPERVGAWGPSAGGHLVALLGTSGDVAGLEGKLGVTGVSSRVQAVVDWYGPTDFLRMNDVPGKMDHDAPDSPESQLVGAPIQDHPDLAARANPITYASEDDPPFLIMHGAQDWTVIQNQSEFLHAALQDTGVPSTLIVLDDQGHGFKAGNLTQDTFDRHVVSFFDRTLKGKPSRWADHDTNPEPWVSDSGPNLPNTRDVLFHSKTLDGYYGYSIYLPPSYTGDTNRQYPTVYWLHGRNGKPHSAYRFIQRAARAVEAGLCPEMIIVAANGLKSSMYIDSRDGVYPVETVIVNDLVPHIESTYRVIPERAGRAIDGFSMGGFGAAHLGFKHPERFGTVSLMGAALHRPEFFSEQRKEIFADVFGNDLSYCKRESPWTLVRKHAGSLKERTHLRLFVGSEDRRLRSKNTEFSTLMDSLGLDHEYGVVEGAGHNVAEVLDELGERAWTFYAKAFRQGGISGDVD